MLINSPRQLLAAIPHLLQFHPTDSVVCVGLDDSRVVCVARFDTADIDTCDAEPVLLGLREAGDPAYVVVTYCDGALALSDLDRLIGQFDGIPQLDILHVDHGRWRSLLCTDETCCPPAGHPVDDVVDPMTVDFIASGSAPFASRDDLTAAFQSRHLPEADLDLRGAAFDSELGMWDCTRQGLADLVTLLREREPMEWPRLALCCRLLADFRWRDALLRLVLEDAALRLPIRGSLMDIATRCPEKFVAPVLTTLAGVVWLDGNGTVARVAVDRALEADPEYSLARLLDRALEAGVPPRVWIDSLKALTVDECLAA